ncbi:MAG: redoxin domain-containing protein [Epsilonproteobacteria bacterium]|nr:redoxin domain-containing protein [Campylobacterota bacterium]
MTDRNSIVKIAVISLIATAAIAYIVISSKSDYRPIVVGDKAPSFVLPLLSGGKIDLAKERGKVVFLNFWATWCTACKEEMASMQWMYSKLMKKYPNKFRMYAISIDSSDVPDIVIKYMKDNGLSFPVLLDTRGRVKEMYKTTGVPETYVVDKRGIVAIKVIGPRDWYNPTNYQPIESLIAKN